MKGGGVKKCKGFRDLGDGGVKCVCGLRHICLSTPEYEAHTHTHTFAVADG